MLAMLFHRLALVALLAACTVALLHRFDPPQQLPLVQAGLQLCKPLPGPSDGNEEEGDEPDEGPPPTTAAIA